MTDWKTYFLKFLPVMSKYFKGSVMPQNRDVLIVNDEISLSDIFKFTIDNWKTIASVCLLGLALSVGYLKMAPALYEATFMIEMASMSSGGSILANSHDPFRGNSDQYAGLIYGETPELLIERLQTPTTYTPTVLNACRIEEAKNSDQSIVGMMKAVKLKTIPFVAKITVRHSSPEEAQDCAREIFEMVKKQQAEMLEPFKRRMQEQLSSLKTRLQKAQASLPINEKTAPYTHIVSLSLASKIDDLELALGLETQTRLISPIYVSNHAVSTGGAKIVLLGAIAGLVAGVFFALGRMWISNSRSRDIAHEER